MSGHQDYLPRTEDGFLDWAENFSTQVAANLTKLSIPAPENTQLQAVFASFKGYHEQCKSTTANSVLRKKRDAARADLTKVIRNMVNFRFANPEITDDMKKLCGVHIKDNVRSNISAPTTLVEFVLRITDIRTVEVDFRDEGASTRARPYGYNGVVISYGVFDSPPTNPDQLTESVLATRSPYKLIFPEEKRGKTVYFALRWENKKGEKGPWSEILSTIVP